MPNPVPSDIKLSSGEREGAHSAGFTQAPVAQPGWIRWLPLIIVESYLSISVLVFAYGPWPWPVENPAQLYTFLALAQVALFLGYLAGSRKQPTAGTDTSAPERWVTISIVLNFVWAYPKFVLRMGRADLTPFGIMQAVVTGLRDSSTAYLQKLDPTVSADTAKLIDRLSTPLWPVLWLAIPLGIVYWRRLGIGQRIGVVLVLLLDLASWVAIGTNKGLADLALILPWLLFMRRLHRPEPINLGVLVKACALVLAGFVAVGAYFSFAMISRGGGEVRSDDASTGISLDESTFISRLFPLEMLPLVGAGASYLTQGYYGLSLSLQEPFVPTYGLGNSWWTIGMSRPFFGPDTISDATYPGRIERQGWDRYVRWHSFYPWMASDVTFPGTLVIVFLMGLLFSRVWFGVLFARDPVAVALFPLFIIMTFYLPANNQVLAFSYTAAPFWSLLALWLFRRRYSSTASPVLPRSR